MKKEQVKEKLSMFQKSHAKIFRLRKLRAEAALISTVLPSGISDEIANKRINDSALHMLISYC